MFAGIVTLIGGKFVVVFADQMPAVGSYSVWSKTWVSDVKITPTSVQFNIAQPDGSESYNSPIRTINDTWSVARFVVEVQDGSACTQGYADYNYVRVAKYSYPEPSVSVGS
jgi:hypothetical protein